MVRHHRARFTVKGICALRDIETLRTQIKEFSPSYVCVVDETRAQELRSHLPRRVKLFMGRSGLQEFSALSSDVSLMAIAGISCLEPLTINIRNTKRIALANKESIVAAGSLVFALARRARTEIIPVDSEINALFQLISRSDDYQRVYLTASGGALLNYTRKDLRRVNVGHVLNHPTWKMGKRVTVDSATLVNKGFEVVETHCFFNVPYDKIRIVLHRESMIHALVECGDGAFFACMYPPDMRMPLSYAFGYPRRVSVAKGLDIHKNFSFSFQPLDVRRFPLLTLILDAARRADNGLVVLNACDEVAIRYFLEKRVKFTDIFKAMEYVYCHYPRKRVASIDDVYAWDAWSREKTTEFLEALT